MFNRKTGFTLIELLVVVLIIGILAAIAAAQYQKAVEKSRAAELMQNLRALINAQEAYYLVNGQYAESFAKLDVNFPSLNKTPASVFNWTNNAKISDDKVALVSDTNPNKAGRLISLSLVGKYAGGTFIYFTQRPPQGAGSLPASLKRGQIYCAEVFDIVSAAYTQEFCKKVIGAATYTDYNGARYWPLP